MDEPFEQTEQRFRALGEYTYVKFKILNKRDNAAMYLEQFRALSGDCEFNRIKQKAYFKKFEAAVVDLYHKLLPYMPTIKNKKLYAPLSNLDFYDMKKNHNPALTHDDFVMYFILLNRMVYDAGISDLNVEESDPAHIFDPKGARQHG